MVSPAPAHAYTAPLRRHLHWRTGKYLASMTPRPLWGLWEMTMVMDPLVVGVEEGCVARLFRGGVGTDLARL